VRFSFALLLARLAFGFLSLGTVQIASVASNAIAMACRRLLTVRLWSRVLQANRLCGALYARLTSLGACPSIERILLAKDERVGFHLPHEQDIPRLED
jgi:hypothetical protein